MGMLWTPYVQKDMGGLSAISGLLVCEHLEVSALRLKLPSFDAKLCFRISATHLSNQSMFNLNGNLAPEKGPDLAH